MDISKLFPQVHSCAQGFIANARSTGYTQPSTVELAVKPQDPSQQAGIDAETRHDLQHERHTVDDRNRRVRLKKKPSVIAVYGAGRVERCCACGSTAQNLD